MTTDTRTEPTLTEIVRPMNKMLRWTLVPLLAIAMLGVAQPAQAQDGEEEAATTFEQDLDTFWADARTSCGCLRPLGAPQVRLQCTSASCVCSSDLSGRFLHKVTLHCFPHQARVGA